MICLKEEERLEKGKQRRKSSEEMTVIYEDDPFPGDWEVREVLRIFGMMKSGTCADNLSRNILLCFPAIVRLAELITPKHFRSCALNHLLL